MISSPQRKTNRKLYRVAGPMFNPYSSAMRAAKRKARKAQRTARRHNRS